MALAREPLDADVLAGLSPAAHKALAPGPGRLMAARGLMPLPHPRELLTVLYQVAVIDPALTTAAVATADGAPESVLRSALSDSATDPRVLDWLVARATRTAALFEALVLNPSTADATIVDLAGRADAGGVDLIAGNEIRLGRCPDIIAALFHNPQARMSTVDRTIEAAVRAGIKVAGIAAWDEMARAVAGSVKPAAEAGAITEVDSLFDSALAAVREVADSAVIATSADEAVVIPEDQDKLPLEDAKAGKVPIGQLSIPAKIRLASLGNAFARSILIRDPLKLVALATIKSPGVTELEAAKYAGSHSLADDVVRYIATRRDWTRLYGIKKSLVMNPKTPISESSKLLIHLRANDLTLVSKSRGVPSAVVAQARKLILQRGGGK